MSTFQDQNAYEPVTALFDSDGGQLFPTIGILSAAVSVSNQFAQHTIEDGTVVTDNKIRLQDRITIKAILSPEDYQSVYQAIKEADNNNEKFTIQTRVDTYDNMYIESRPYEESSKIANTIAVVIAFIEQKTTGIKTSALPASKVKNAADADTSNSGSKLPSSDESTLLKISNTLGDLF